jgi:DNA-directed RNA polymerase specialized sigma24 family protein
VNRHRKELRSQLFSTTYRRLYPHLFGLAFDILRHRQDAEDVVQDAFLAFWEAGPTLSDVAARQWLTAETLRRCGEPAPCVVVPFRRIRTARAPRERAA